MELRITVNASGTLLSGKAPATIQKGLEQAITSATLLLYTEVAKRTPQGVYGAQGGLIGSIQQEVRYKGTPIVKGIVASASKYAEVIEKGRTPGKGMPPKGSLVRWLEVKMGLDAASAGNIEYVVRRSIGRKGFPGVHMFEKALDDNFSRVQTIFEKQGLTIAKELGE